jgi:hypothetical protein
MAEHLLRIMVGDKQVVLYPGEKVKFVLKSPLMSIEPEVGSRIFSFRVPAEPNANIFGTYNRLDSRKKISSVDCDVYLGPTLFTKGKLDITSYDNEEFEIRVRFDRSYYQDFSAKSLKDFEYKRPNPYRYNADKALHPYRNYGFNFGSMVLGNSFTITLTYTHPEDRVNTITFAQTFIYDGTLAFFDLVVNTFVDYLMDSFDTTGFYAENIGSDTIRLYEFFNYVQLPELSFASTNTGFCNVTSSADVVPSSTTVLNTMYNTPLDNDGFDYVFFPVHSPSLFDPAVSSGVFDGWMNLYNPKIAGDPSYPGTPRNGFLTPFPYVKEVLYQLHQEFGISIEEDTFFDAEMQKLVFWTDQAINSSYRVPERGWEGQLLLSFLYKNIVPGIKVADQIKDLRYLFNVIIDYNSRKSSIRILSCNSLLASNDLDDINSKVLYGYEYSVQNVKFSFDYTWPSTELLTGELLPELNKLKLMPAVDFKSDLPAPLKSDGYETRYAQNENNYFKWNPDLGEWVLHATEFYPYLSTGNEIQEVVSLGSPLFEELSELVSLTVFNNVKWLNPHTKQTGNMYKSDQVDPAHRYLFYRGWQGCDVKETTEGPTLDALYPFGSYHTYNYQKVKIANYSLSWNHEDGLINTWWKKFINFAANTAPVKLEVNFSISDLANMDLLQKKLFQNVQYFFDEVEFEVTDKIGVSNVKCYPIKESYE